VGTSKEALLKGRLIMVGLLAQTSSDELPLIMKTLSTFDTKQASLFRRLTVLCLFPLVFHSYSVFFPSFKPNWEHLLKGKAQYDGPPN